MTGRSVGSVRDRKTPRRVRRCGVISYALSRQPYFPSLSLRRLPCQLDFRPRRCGGASPLLFSPVVAAGTSSASGHAPSCATPPSWRILPAAPQENAQTQLVCRIFGVVCLSRMSPRPRTVRSGLTTIFHLCFLTQLAGTRQHRGENAFTARGNIVIFLFVLLVCVFSDCTSSKSVLTIFPDFATFGYIFLWYAIALGLHVWVRAYCWLLVS